jgi:hypothetical protein
MKQTHERVLQTKNLEHQRFNSAVIIVALISLILAIVGVMSLWRGMHWPAGAMGAALALTFQRITALLKVSK